jgi:hypothetical protein
MLRFFHTGFLVCKICVVHSQNIPPGLKIYVPSSSVMARIFVNVRERLNVVSGFGDEAWLRESVEDVALMLSLRPGVNSACPFNIRTSLASERY